jgi:hypothetical protein
MHLMLSRKPPYIMMSISKAAENPGLRFHQTSWFAYRQRTARERVAAQIARRICPPRALAFAKIAEL